MNKAGLFKKVLPYIIIFLGVAYGLWPVDMIPDIPLAGWIDDAGIIGTAFFIALRLFTKKNPPPGEK